MTSLLEKSPVTTNVGECTNGAEGDIKDKNSSNKQLNGNFLENDLDISSILREKISNNDTTYSLGNNPEPTWLYEVDAFREKIKNQHFKTANNASNNYLYNNSERQPNYSYAFGSENQKLDNESFSILSSHSATPNFHELSNQQYEEHATHLQLDNKFQTRSESEPNNICDLRYSAAVTKISNNMLNEHRSKLNSYKKLPPTPPKQNNRNTRINNYDRSPNFSYEDGGNHLISNNKNESKKSFPPKVLLYNNSQTPRSPKSRKSLANTKPPLSRLSSAIVKPTGSNNEFRRCKTKSPSPTFSRNLGKRLDVDESNIKFKSKRKAKSATPPPVTIPKTFEQFTTAAYSKPKFVPLPVSENNLLHTIKSNAKGSNLEKYESQDSSESNLNVESSNILEDKSFEKVDSSTKNGISLEDDEESYYDDDDEFALSENDDYIESSSDSENGYKGHAFSRGDSSSSPILESPTIDRMRISMTSGVFTPPDSILTPSLFPNVPPYLSFSTHLEKGPFVPPELHKILKWKLSKVMPKVVRHTLSNSGCRILKKTNEWMGTWGKHMKSPCFRAVRPYQKMNHLPGSFKIGRKDSCWKNLQKQINKHGKKEFGFMPKTYIFPNDINILRKMWPKYQQKSFRWIIKPPASARGTGIKVVFAWSQIPKRKPLIVQRYIERPLLINGSKFDIRLYVLVTSINPLRVYMYKDGLARFASIKYSTRAETLHDRCMHLTNYSINKHSSNYSKNEDVNACEGHKWTLKSLMNYLAETGVDTNLLWQTMKNLILRTLLAGEEGINNMVRLNTGSRYNTFELFGFDILLDSSLVPWLLEVNISPSLHSDLPLDMHVKGPLVQAVLNTALYHVPPKLSAEKQKDISEKIGIQGPICYDKRLYVTYLSRAEKIKHNQFTRKDLEDRDQYLDAILENLTPDDVRCLITAEDELARCLPLERIFPTNKSYKFLKYTESPRYYNRLLDAWEFRYHRNRPAGIKLLTEFCEKSYHLQVPPVPTQRNIQNRTRAMSKIPMNSSTPAMNTMETQSEVQESIPSTTTVTPPCVKLTNNNNNNQNKKRTPTTKFSCWALARAAKKRIIKRSHLHQHQQIINPKLSEFDNIMNHQQNQMEKEEIDINQKSNHQLQVEPKE